MPGRLAWAKLWASSGGKPTDEIAGNGAAGGA